MSELVGDDKVQEIAEEAAKEAASYPHEDALYQAAWQAVRATIRATLKALDGQKEAVKPGSICEECLSLSGIRALVAEDKTATALFYLRALQKQLREHRQKGEIVQQSSWACSDCRRGMLPWKEWYSPEDDHTKRICPECWEKRNKERS